MRCFLLQPFSDSSLEMEISNTQQFLSNFLINVRLCLSNENALSALPPNSIYTANGGEGGGSARKSEFTTPPVLEVELRLWSSDKYLTSLQSDKKGGRYLNLLTRKVFASESSYLRFLALAPLQMVLLLRQSRSNPRAFLSYQLIRFCRIAYD